MEDYKWIIYLILSILWFFFQKGGSKKKKTRPKPMAEEESKRPSTFEEILRELSNEQPQREPQQQDTIDSKDEIPELKDIAEERLMDQETPQRHLENADDTLKEMYKKGERLKSIDELVDIEEVPTRSDRFKQFDQKKKRTNRFLKEIKSDFSDPKSARKAFIYGEIFNRKY